MAFYQMLKSKLNIKLVGVILGISVLATICLIGKEYISLEKEINSLIQGAVTNESIVKQSAQEKILYTIDFGDGKVRTFQIVPTGNSTAFSLLEELAKRENFKVESKVYEGMGVFVESIDGIKNGADNKYWQYWVNSELPMVAADKKEIKKGDKVEWRFSPSPY
jgi:hypothetical protein